MTAPVPHAAPVADARAPGRARGWRRPILALLAALAIPLVAIVRLAVPIETTIVLLAPAMAACALVGWVHGGPGWLAATWTGLALWIVAGTGAGLGAYEALARGWGLLLAAAFGVVGMTARSRAFLPRALAATGLAVGAALVVMGVSRSAPGVVQGRVADEIGRRLAAAESEWQVRSSSAEWRDLVRRYPDAATVMDQGEAQLRAIPPITVRYFPALLALESVAMLGLAWSLYHRASRQPIGEALRPVREFRFNDQLVWGFILGITLLVLPTLREARGVGGNLLAFFGALYVLRGLGVLEWFLGPRGILRALFYLAMFLAWPIVGAIALALGLGDTWIDWRGRARPAT